MASQSEDWQSGKSVLTCNRYMLEDQVACDVTFLVGENRKTMAAHKYMLISRSCVFHAMLCGPLAEKVGEAIAIPDIEPDVFENLLKYIYCEEAVVEPDNAIPLLYAAKKYSVQGLVENCLTFLEGALSSDNVCCLLEQATLFDEVVLKEKCLSCVRQHPEAVLNSPNFTAISITSLEDILKDDELDIKEAIVFDATIKWTEEACQRKGLEVNGPNQRKLLGKLLYLIRFPVMDLKYFTEKVSKRCLLSPEETIEVFQYLCGDEKVSTQFPCRPREITIDSCPRHIFSRFSGHRAGSGTYHGDPDVIVITPSHDGLFLGVGMYGSYCKRGNYRVKLSVVDSLTSEVIASKDTTVETDGKTMTYDILIDKPVRIEKKRNYTIELLVKGPCGSVRGINGQKRVDLDGKIIIFSKKQAGPSNRTDVNSGQLPHIICCFRD